VEAQGLAHHEIVVPHQPDAAEEELTKLNVELLNSDDAASRAHILEAIYGTEQQLGTDPESNNPPPTPVRLRELQLNLSASELLVEYVLSVRNRTRSPSPAIASTNMRFRREIFWRRTQNSTGMARPAMSVQFVPKDRRAILENVLSALRKRFYSPEKRNGDWHAAVERHKTQFESAGTADEFEKAISDLLAELHTSHVGFFHSSARRASSRAALSAAYLADETPHGKRWIFQHVHSGGAASIAGIQPGDILLSVDGREMIPPEHPVFAMGKKAELEIVGTDDKRRVVAVNVARPKGKKLHFVEPTVVEARQLRKGIGYLKVAIFPGMVGVEVANEISSAIAKLGAVESLIIDLRGNTGGGLGALRMMSLLTPDRIPVGFALDRRRVTASLESEKQGCRRFSRIPSSTKTLWLLAVQFAPTMMAKKPIVLQTEGLGKRPFHGRTVLLVDRHTASAAEMIVAFARENGLATIIGEKTAGRLLSAASVKVGNGFRLALPTGAYYTWKGSVLEGTPIEPDHPIEFNWSERRLGRDQQLERKTELLETAGAPSAEYSTS
jgi:carboxyl-terminal processing protease